MAQKNYEILETYLNDIIFTEEKILEKVKDRAHIFEIKNEEHTLGFISFYDLSAYVDEHEEEAVNFSIRNIDSLDWVNIFKHLLFQRRKPRLVSEEKIINGDDSTFFILHKGQKKGPYNKFQLMEMIEQKEIILSDMVSLDGRNSWFKLYTLEGLDRRSFLNNENLPGKPDQEILEQKDLKIKIDQTMEAITSLAFLGNQKKGNIKDREKENSYKEEMKNKNTANSIYRWMLLASIFGIIYFIFNIKSHLNSPFKTPSTTALGEKEKSSVENITEEVNNQNRPSNMKSRSLKPIKPSLKKSFTESNKYKESNNRNNRLDLNTADDNHYYDDNPPPMELDPIRKQISKESFDNPNPLEGPMNDSLGEPAPQPENEPALTLENTN